MNSDQAIIKRILAGETITHTEPCWTCKGRGYTYPTGWQASPGRHSCKRCNGTGQLTLLLTLSEVSRPDARTVRYNLDYGDRPVESQ